MEIIYTLLLEREVPLTTTEMAIPLIERHQERLIREAEKAEAVEAHSYKPAETYKEGQTILFPALENSVGKVVSIRPGQNPDIPDFDVLKISFSDNETRYFAARLEDHALNQVPVQEDEAEDSTPEGILAANRRRILTTIEKGMRESADIVQIAGRWFPSSLLADINEGHLNLAEAVLDVSDGGPLPTSDFLEHLDLSEDLDPLLAEFSLDYALQEDERFDEVGPAGQTLWYLRRQEPPEVLFLPARLEYKPHSYNHSVLTETLLELEKSLDDELSDEDTEIEEEIDEVTVTLLFPHWRVGTLPLSARLRNLFPTAYEAPRIRFMLVDAHSGDEFPGWVVREEKYVYGLDDWYRRYEVPAGGLVHLKRGDKPGTVIVSTVNRRKRNEWIRTLTIGENSKIGFTMLKRPVGSAFDELSVIGLMDPVLLDEAWLKSEPWKIAVERLVSYTFKQLAKINPQTAVHAKALYTGVNVFRRLPPGAIFAELIDRPYYHHVGDLYWRFDDNQWSES
ncbi:MAG: hypothetical protein JXA25_02355 [Anaerolineales bacterium]|nr:hypothetical protein [Anaerolineales bacterium]